MIDQLFDSMWQNFEGIQVPIGPIIFIGVIIIIAIIIVLLVFDGTPWDD